MADHRITDFVDPQAIASLQRLKDEIDSVKAAYVEASKELIKGLNANVGGLDDLEKLGRLLQESQKKAADSTERLTRAVSEQRDVYGRTTAQIAESLQEINKMDRELRQSKVDHDQVRAVLERVNGTYDQKLKRLIEVQQQMKGNASALKTLESQYKTGAISLDDYNQQVFAITKAQRELSQEKASLTSRLKNEEKEMNSVRGSYNHLSQELELLKKSYKDLTDEEKQEQFGKEMLAVINQLDTELKHQAEDMGEHQRNVGDYAIALRDGVAAAEDLNRVLGIESGTIAGCIEQNKALEQAKLNLDTRDSSYAETLDRINAKIEENKGRILDVDAILSKEAVTIGEAQEQNKLLAEALKLVDLSAEGAKEKVEEINRKMDENSKLVEDNGGAQDSLKKQLKELVLEIATLTVQYRSMSEEEKGSAQGRELSEKIDELTEKAGDLKDAIGDVNRAIATSASDTKAFDQIGEGIGLLIDGFGLATGATAMLGLSEEDLIAIQTKLQAAMAASNAITKIQNTLQKESALMQGITAIQVKAHAVAENIRTAAVGKGVIATKAASVAQAAFNAIAAANPYVLLAIALMTVVGALYAFSRGSGDAERAQKALNDEIERTRKGIDAIEDESDFDIRLAKAAGASEEAIRKMRLEAAKAADDLAYLNLQKVSADPNSTKEQYEEALNLYKETGKKINDIIRDNIVAEREAQHKTEEDRKKAAEAAAKEAKRKEEAQKKELERRREAAKTIEDIEKSVLSSRLSSLDLQIKAAVEFSEEWKTLMERSAQVDFNIKVIDIRKQLDKNLKDVEESYAMGKISKEEHDAAIISLNKDANEHILAANKELADALADVEERMAQDALKAIQDRHAAKVAIDSNAYASSLAALKKEYAEELAAAGNNAQKRAEITKRYEDNAAKLTEDYAQQSAQSQIDMLEEMLSVEDLSAEEREKLEAELAKAKIDLEDAVADAAVNSAKRIADADKDATEKRIENAQKWLQVASNALNSINELSSAIFSAKIQKIEEEADAVAAAGEKDLEMTEELVTKKVISEEEGEARKRAAEAKTAKKSEELERKKQQLQHKQAVWDKANKLAQTAISTALGIMQTIASVGFPAAIPMIAAVSAIGAINLATILATPIPKYKEGTSGHKGGLAVVGDGGRRELVSFGGSVYITPDKPTLVEMPRGAVVYPDADELVAKTSAGGRAIQPLAEAPSVVVNNDYARLERQMSDTNALIRQLMKQQRAQSYYANYQNFKRSRL